MGGRLPGAPLSRGSAPPKERLQWKKGKIAGSAPPTAAPYLPWRMEPEIRAEVWARDERGSWLRI